VGDILIRQVVFEQMLDRNLPLPALYQPKCPECGAEVEPFDRSLVMISEDKCDAVSVPVRRSSRTAIDRHRGVAADGQLYTLEMIEPMDDHRRPVTFRGRVQGSAEKIKIVNRWIGHVSTVGSGRSRGLGHIQVNVIDARAAKEPLPELEDRLKAFNQRMREEWAFYSRVAGVDPLPEGVFYFSLDLLAPAILDWHGVPVTAPSPAMLGFESGVQLDRGFADYEVVGGWHQGAGLPRRKQTAATLGSVFLYRSEGFALKELARHLSSLEAKGIGSDRARGFGRVLICLPFHYQPEVNV
jgi:CRISPR-associated Csx10 family RAMP protein